MGIDISEVKNVQLRPVRLDLGEHMKTGFFQKAVRHTAFHPDDGIGFLATEIEESNISVWDIADWTEWPEWATYVVWYNK